MAIWNVEPIRETLHGKFSREFPPALTVDPGDTVHFRTLDAAWWVEDPRPDWPKVKPRRFEPFDSEHDGGHALCGPVAIRGAKPGMTLEVRIDEIQVGPWGWTSACGWPHRVHKFLGLHKGEEVCHLWSLDRKKLIGQNQHGHRIKLRPFMGVMGMPPDEPGRHSTAPPRFTGGNLDCKELVAGTTLYLPIAVDQGLFSVGDGHAAQGDGEACVTAIECPMDRVTLTFGLRDDMPLKAPRARIDGAWLTFGLDKDLNKASLKAVEGMVELMGELHGFDRRNALALASLVVDLRVTQIVNGVQGVHAVLRDGALEGR